MKFSWKSVNLLSSTAELSGCKKGLPGGTGGKESACQCGRRKKHSLEDPLGEKVATHSSILAWRIPWTEEPGGLQPRGLQRVNHSGSDLACAHKRACGSQSLNSCHYTLYRKSLPIPNLCHYLLTLGKSEKSQIII